METHERLFLDLKAIKDAGIDLNKGFDFEFDVSGMVPVCKECRQENIEEAKKLFEPLPEVPE